MLPETVMLDHYKILHSFIRYEASWRQPPQTFIIWAMGIYRMI